MASPPDAAREAAIRRHFEAMLDLPPEARHTYLDEECPDDLRDHVADLVATAGDGDDYLDALAGRALSGMRSALRAKAGDESEPEDRLLGRLASALGSEYEDLHPVGQGGMGRVFRARHAPLDRPVAIKVLAPALREDPEARTRFELEARSAAGLSHPNVVPIYTVDALADGLPFITMRFVPGGSLRDWIHRHGRVPAPEALRIVRQVASALDAAHRRGIVHRDVKPGNILLDGDTDAPRPPERVLLTDFGIAKAAGGGETALTVAGGLVGSPRYMSPEQVAGDDLDARSDLYSLGVVAYELIAGRPPFEETVMHRMIVCHLTEPPPPLAEVAPHCPDRIARIVHRCLEKEPARRFAGASALVDAIDAIDAAHTEAVTDGEGGPATHAAATLSMGRRVLAGTLVLAVLSVLVDRAFLGGYTVSALVVFVCATMAVETARRLWLAGYTARQILSSGTPPARYRAVTSAPLAEERAAAVRRARAERALLLRTFHRIPRSEQQGMPHLRATADRVLRRVSKAARELDVLDRTINADGAGTTSVGIVGEQRRSELDEAHRRLESELKGGISALARVREALQRYAARGGAEGLEPVLQALERADAARAARTADVGG